MIYKEKGSNIDEIKSKINHTELRSTSISFRSLSSKNLLSSFSETKSEIGGSKKRFSLNLRKSFTN